MPFRTCRMKYRRKKDMGSLFWGLLCLIEKFVIAVYKLYAFRRLSGAICFFNLIKASVYDGYYLKNVKYEYDNWSVYKYSLAI